MTTRTEIPSSIATAPGALPLLGHTVSMARDPLAFLRRLPGSGPLVRVHLGRSARWSCATPS